MKKSKKNIKSKVSKTKKLNKLLGGTLVHNLPNLKKGTHLEKRYLKSFSELGVCKKIPKSDKKIKVSKPTFRKFYAVEYNDDVYLYYFDEDKNEYQGRLKVLNRDWFENGLENNDNIINDLDVEDDKGNGTTISLEFDNKDKKEKFKKNYQNFLESVKKEQNRLQNNNGITKKYINNMKKLIRKEANKRFGEKRSRSRSRSGSRSGSSSRSRSRSRSGSRSRSRSGSGNN